jgi:hypothetical protein
MGKTTYIVLRKDGEGWVLRGTPEARTPEAACEAALLGSGDDGAAELVAVPARYWRPDLYSVVTERRVVRGG